MHAQHQRSCGRAVLAQGSPRPASRGDCNPIRNYLGYNLPSSHRPLNPGRAGQERCHGAARSPPDPMNRRQKIRTGAKFLLQSSFRVVNPLQSLEDAILWRPATAASEHGGAERSAGADASAHLVGRTNCSDWPPSAFVAEGDWCLARAFRLPLPYSPPTGLVSNRGSG